MSECHRTKSLSKGIKIVSKTKGPQIRSIPHREKRTGSMQIELQITLVPIEF